MSTTLPTTDASLSPSMTKRVDAACDHFESAWKAGQRPRIEDYLGEIAGAERSALCHELLVVELVYRYRLGERPTPEEYWERFPTQVNLVDTALDELDLSVPQDPQSTTRSYHPGRESPDPEGSLAQRPEKRIRKAGWPEIAGYDILAELGQGGMGVVYLARQTGLNRRVAVKMIRGGSQARPEQFARFRVEAEAVAQLRHPNIIQIHEIGEVDGLPFVSLELLEGGSLADRLKGTPQPARSSAELLITLVRAVQAAHEVGIIHRDLKPSNVLFTGDGTPIITDFGLAKRIDSDSGQTESGQILGSPSYMAPEQARGHTREIGPAADVYALGAILYEMLTGRPPFKGETPLETVRQVLEDDVVPPSRLVPKVARDLETICLHCLKKEPAKRYGSTRALAEDLENFLADRPIQARRTPFWERGVKLMRRHPVGATLLTLGLAAALGGSGYLVHSSYQRQQHALEENLRIAGLNGNAWRKLLQSQEFLGQGKWSDAEIALTKVQAEIRDEPVAADLARRTAELLEQAELGRSAQEARSRARESLRTFLACRRDALFQETHFLWLDRPYEPAKVRAAVRAALAVFAAPGSKEAWALGPLPESFTATERDDVRAGCYELLLVLAETEKPDQALRVLDAAGTLGPASRAYHLRRADCRARLGDAAAAERERRAADAMPLASPLDHFLAAKDLYRRESWAEALGHFDTTLTRQPGHFWANCLSAICCLQLHRPGPAWSRLTACLQAEPDLAWLHQLRGFASYKIAGAARMAAETLHARGGTLSAEIEHQLQSAEADYQRALELLDAAPSPTLRYAVLLNRGLLWLMRRQWDKAEADLQAAMRLDDKQWQLFEILAQVYLQQDRSDQAIAQFTRAIALRPDWAPLYRARAAVNLDRKDQMPAHRAQALADLDRAIRLEPAGSALSAHDQTGRARLMHHDAREEEALAACDAALKADPGYLDAHQLRIEVLRELKRYEEVIRSCDALLARSRPSSELYAFRGLAKEKLRDYLGAIEDQTLAIALQPGAAPLLARRGKLHLVSDAPRLALSDFERALRIDSLNADAYLGRGLALAALGQHRAAVADAAKALELAEPTPTRLYNAARIHAQAAIVAAAEVRQTGRDAVSLVNRYQAQATELARRWLKRIPAAERPRALRDLLQDPAMASLRRRLRSLELAGAVFSSPS